MRTYLVSRYIGTSRTTSRWRSTQKFWSTQNFIKKMTGRVDIYSGAFLRKLQKKVKWSHRKGKMLFLVYLSENVQKIYFFGSSIWIFAVFLKMRQTLSTLPVILSFMKNFSNRRTSRTTFRWISTRNVDIEIWYGLYFFVYF